MNSCFKVLYDYEIVKKRNFCKIVFLKSNFHENKNTTDGFEKQSKSCRKQYYTEKLVKIKKFYLGNRDRIKDYYSKKYDKITSRRKFFFIKDTKQISIFV